MIARRVGLLVLCWSVVSRLMLAAEPALPTVAGLQVGLADRYKAGVWTQVEITLHGGEREQAGTLVLTVPDDEGIPARFPAPGGVRLPAGRDTAVRMCVRFGRVEGTLTAEFNAAGKTLVRRTFTAADTTADGHFLKAMDCNQELFLVLGPDLMGVDEAAAGRQNAAEFKPVVVHVEDPARLPRDAYAYEGVTAVILPTSRPDALARLDASGPQLAALAQWIRLGGRALVTLGSQAERVLAPAGGLAKLVPGKLQAMVDLRQMGLFETYAETTVPVPLPADLATAALRVPRLAVDDAKVELRDGDLPLVIRAMHGLGQVVVATADLDQAPWAAWRGRPLLLRQLLNLGSLSIEESARSRAVMHYGFVDTAGQLRKALNQFRGVEVISFWLIALLIVGYVALIGPVDYFFLRKLLRRMELTWITFPLWVLLAGGLAWWMADRYKGHAFHVNQLDLVDADLASGLVRGTTWANLYSPRSQGLDLTARANLPAAAPDAPGVRLGWFGLAGNSLGGMAPRSIDTVPWSESYAFAPGLDRIEGLPIEVWSTRSITVRWHATAAPGVEAALSIEDQALSGTLTNRLPVGLKQGLILWKHWAHDVGDLGPGQAVMVGARTRRSDLKTLLTGRKLVKDKTGDRDRYLQETPPFDRASLDLPYILRAMMFFDAAGGTPYTDLYNGHQAFVDLSLALRAGRAVLLAYASDDSVAPVAAPGTQLLVGGQPLAGPHAQRTVAYRCVIPVKPNGSDQE